MKKGSILGVDLNEKSCQISYYDENKEEPETMEAAVDNYQIPLILGCHTSVPEGREKKKSTCRRKDT